MKPPSARLFACALLPAALALGHAACSSSNSNDDLIDVTTLYVDPSYFKGSVICGPYEGAMQTYVVTLVDETDGADNATTLPSSPPTPCDQLAGFGDKLIVADRTYHALVDAYDVPACNSGATVTPCIVPYGGMFTDDDTPLLRSGERAMALVVAGDPLSPGDPAWVPLRAATPSWQPLYCDAVTARLLASTRFTDCTPSLTPLRDEQGNPYSGLALSIKTLRGPLNCAGPDDKQPSATVGKVAVEFTHVVAAPSVEAGGSGGAGGSAGSAGSAGSGGAAGSGGSKAVLPSKNPEPKDCAATDDQLRFDALTVGATYGFRVAAFDGSGVLRWGTTCEGTPIVGVRNYPMKCEPLDGNATLRVPFDGVLAAAYAERFGVAAPTCTDATVVNVALGNQGPLQPDRCDDGLLFSALPPGVHTLRGTLQVDAVSPPRDFICNGYTLPAAWPATPAEIANAVSCQFL